MKGIPGDVPALLHGDAYVLSSDGDLEETWFGHASRRHVMHGLV